MKTITAYNLSNDNIMVNEKQAIIREDQIDFVNKIEEFVDHKYQLSFEFEKGEVTQFLIDNAYQLKMIFDELM